MSAENCIFCKILADEIPSAVVYEDDLFRAILDVNPAAKGHVIILPKKHAANLFELPDEEASKILIVARKIARAVMATYHCDGVNILQNNFIDKIIRQQLLFQYLYSVESYFTIPHGL